MMASPSREARVDRLPSKLPINLQGACRGEVLPWPERRRRWSWKEKAQIVAESLAPDAVASAIARRYGLHRNQLYAWRKELREMADGGPEAARGAARLRAGGGDGRARRRPRGGDRDRTLGRSGAGVARGRSGAAGGRAADAERARMIVPPSG